ncbi:MAG: NUDIX hydrolase [Dehalococcoidia bacterium]|nr:NUDIX hydrolase [Dehalococcoidia bacterium]MCA9845278.1 NUDIX hydrolase [Dehalococcoidia bacterium]
MVRRGLPVRDAESAGGVVYRVEGDRTEVVICKVAGRDTWALPKGTPEDGESRLSTAIREVQEETGLAVEPVAELGSIDYWFVGDGHRVHKIVYFWLMTAAGGCTADHDSEFDVVEWVPLDQALQRLSYKGEREVVSLAAGRIASGV